MITGSLLSVGGIAVRNIVWPHFLPGWKENNPELSWLQSLPEKFPFHGVEMAFGVAIIACSTYVIVSLLSKRPPVNMDKLLNRGEYAVEADGHQPGISADSLQPIAPAEPAAEPATAKNGSSGQATATMKPVTKFWRRLGLSDEFTKGDRFIFFFKIAVTLFFFGTFLVITPLAIIFKFTDDWWLKYWAFYVSLTVVLGVGTTIWFLIGGFHDLIDMIRTLQARIRDESDDGWVRKEQHVQKDD